MDRQHGGGHEKPVNEKLWAMVVQQARARFTVYPSPAAAHWVHQEYANKGGQFVDTSKQKHRRGH